MLDATDKTLIEVRGARKLFPIFGGFFKRTVGHVKAVDSIGLSIERGETLGLVGESGCGKTTLGRCITRLIPLSEGEILYNFGGEFRSLDTLGRKERFNYSKKVQIVFQDPYSSMNPIRTVFDAFDEPLRVHGMGAREQRRELIAQLMEVVNLHADHMYRHPHEFSGGQLQRICIARALCLNPEMLVLDEPVSSLDVSIQAQILNLLQDIQLERKITYLFIAHDLSVVEYMSTRIAVMYLGKIVELAKGGTLYTSPRHHYTEALLSAVPIPELDRERNRIVLEGDVPSPANPPTGCRFHPRCRMAKPECALQEPMLTDCGDEHMVACHFPLKA